MTAPKIAIIVPVYNVERYVIECLESIRHQTYKNWKCFVIDDGSTDLSGKIIDEYSEKDERFKIFHIPNSGQGSVRNYALNMLENSSSKFDYVAFVDSDDIIEKDMYSMLVEAIQTDHTDLVVCGFYDYFRSGKRNSHYSAKPKKISNEDFVELVFGLGKWRNHPCSQGMIWKLLIKYEHLKGLRFPIDRETCEDEPFNIFLANRVKTVTLLPESLYGYRQRAGSAIRSKNFNFALLKGRKICVETAANISKRAELTALGAYINTLLALVKEFGLISYIDQLSFDVNDEVLKLLVSHGYVKKKNATLLGLAEKRRTIFVIYLKVRKMFHLFRSKIKSTDEYFP